MIEEIINNFNFEIDLHLMMMNPVKCMEIQILPIIRGFSFTQDYNKRNFYEWIYTSTDVLSTTINFGHYSIVVNGGVKF